MSPDPLNVFSSLSIQLMDLDGSRPKKPREDDPMFRHKGTMSKFPGHGVHNRRIAIAGVLAASLLFLALAPSQEKSDDDTIWKAFIGWFRSAPKEADPFKAYAAKLGQEGVPEQEIQRRVAVVFRLFSERPEGVEIFFDWAFSKPMTGDPAKDGISLAPTAFLVDTVKGMKPGVALDVGTGQGRNAVYLAKQRWDVTGMDISQVALDAARANADKSGVRIRTEKAAYDTFDFGVNKWDLIVIVFAWAPVSDPAFVAKLKISLRPGGVVLYEHFMGPRAPMIRAPGPNELKTFFADFDIVSYEETQGPADWGGPKSRLVRMLARKRS
jgi:SAM-dependent methyltransferase